MKGKIILSYGKNFTHCKKFNKLQQDKNKDIYPSWRFERQRQGDNIGSIKRKNDSSAQVGLTPDFAWVMEDTTQGVLSKTLKENNRRCRPGMQKLIFQKEPQNKHTDRWRLDIHDLKTYFMKNTTGIHSIRVKCIRHQWVKLNPAH